MNKKILYSALLCLILFIIATPVVVFGEITSLPPAGGAAGGGDATLSGFAGSIKAALITIGTSVVIVGWIIAGILYLTAAGSPEKIGTAKKALVACVIGTVLVILADASNSIISVIKSALFSSK